MNFVAETKFTPSIVVVPAKEMEPVMGTACEFKAQPVIARIRQMLLGDVKYVFIV